MQHKTPMSSTTFPGITEEHHLFQAPLEKHCFWEEEDHPPQTLDCWERLGSFARVHRPPCVTTLQVQRLHRLRQPPHPRARGLGRFGGLGFGGFGGVGVWGCGWFGGVGG